jgi:hypothetical protein
LLPAEHVRERTFGLGAIELLKNMVSIGGVGREKLEKRPNGREAPGDGGGGFLGSRLALQVEAEVVGVGGGEGFGSRRAKPFVEIVEIAPVRVQRIVGQAAFGREVDEERPKFRRGTLRARWQASGWPRVGR